MKKLPLQCLTVALATLLSFPALAQLSGYYQEDFEGTFPPDGWQTVDVADPLNVWQQSAVEPYSGTMSAHINYSGVDVIGEDWLILPQFSVAASDSFSFWMAADFVAYPPDTTWILVSTSNDDLSSFTSVVATLIEGVNYPNVSDVYWYYSWSLEGFAGQDIYVAVRNKNIYGDGLFFDLFSIGSATSAPCVTPSGPSTFGVSASSAKLTWDAVPGAQAYKILYRSANSPTWKATSATNNGKKLTGLSANTKYVWQVQTLCSTNPVNTSEWSEKQSFITSAVRLEEDVTIRSMEVYPNPFVSSTNISLSLEENSHVVAELFDLTGRKLQTVIDADLSAGDHNVDLNAGSLSAGTYMLQVHFNNDEMMVQRILVQ